MFTVLNLPSFFFEISINSSILSLRFLNFRKLIATLLFNSSSLIFGFFFLNWVLNTSSVGIDIFLCFFPLKITVFSSIILISISFSSPTILAGVGSFLPTAPCPAFPVVTPYFLLAPSAHSLPALPVPNVATLIYPCEDQSPFFFEATYILTFLSFTILM